MSNTCEIEWPPKSNRHITIPEVDRGAWFQLAVAAQFIREEQGPFLERLEDLLRSQERRTVQIDRLFTVQLKVAEPDSH